MAGPHKIIRITTVPISLKVLLRKQLRFMSQYFEVVGVSSPGSILQEVAEQEGVRTEAVNMTRAITPIQDLKAIWSLYRLFRKEKPTIVHTHTPKAGLLGMIAGRLARVPIRIHTVAGLPLMEARGKKRILLEKVEQLTYAAATAIYPNSGNLSTFILANRFCAPSKVKVLGNGSSNGIDTTFFQPSPALHETADRLRESLKIAAGDFVFVFIGRLVRDKGIEELVSAFAEIKKKHQAVRLLLVGPFEPDLDPISPATEKMIREDERITLVGFQQDVRPYYMISHALAFPSYREGFPNVPMQAGCFGLPAIVTDINGCNEIIQDGRNGIIIPAKNVDRLREAMTMMLENVELYLQMKKHARPMIVDRYEQQHLWNLILKEYQEQIQHVS
ncbi:MAG: glycosyltransferase family 1 protein [Chitinophagaceae bacterium]|nr:MAG: glycosyltransferase family 1 protein [Chitinophagaceae bacterium]